MFSHLFRNRSSSWGGSWRGRAQLSGMAAGGLELRIDEDPWKVSAFISAFTELLLSVLLLLGAAIAFITSQFVKYFGLEPPCSYVGCSHPGHSEVSPRQRFPIPSPCANEFSVNDICPDCNLSGSCSNFPYKSFILTDGHHDEDARETLENYDSSSRDHNAAEADKVFECQNIQFKRKKNRGRKNALTNLATSDVVCAHCSHPLSNSVAQHTSMKKAGDEGRDARCRPYVHINDDRSVGAVSSKTVTEDDLPLFSAKPVFADGNNSDSDDNSETSISAESMDDYCLEKKGRLWGTGFGDLFEETPRNISLSAFRDTECDFQVERLDCTFQHVDDTQSSAFYGSERKITRPDGSCHINDKEFKGEKFSTNNIAQFVTVGDAHSKEPAALFKHEGNVHEMTRKIDHELVEKRSLQAESTEGRGDFIAENMNAPLQKQGEVNRTVTVLESVKEGSSGERTFDRDEVVDIGTGRLNSSEKGDDRCEQEQLSKIGKDTDLTDSRDDVGGRLNLSFKALWRSSVSYHGEDAEACVESDVQNLTQSEDMVSKVKTATTLGKPLQALQLIDSSGKVALEGSENLCRMAKNVKVDLYGLLNSTQQHNDLGNVGLKGPLDSCDPKEADTSEGMGEVSFVTSKADSKQDHLHAGHSDAPQQEDISRGIKLEQLVQQEGDGWFGDLSQQEQFISVPELIPGMAEGCQLDADFKQDIGSVDCVGCRVLEIHQRLTSTDESNRLSGRKSVIKHHLDEAEQGQNVGGLDAEQGMLELGPCSSESEGEVDVLKGLESKLVNLAPNEADDLQNSSGKHKKNLVGEKVFQHEVVSGLADVSHHKECPDSTEEFNRCPFKDSGLWVKDSVTLPAVSLQVDPAEVRIAEIGIGHLGGVEPSSEEKKSIVSEQPKLPNRFKSGNAELAHGQFTGPRRDVPGNVDIGEELDESSEDLGLDASKNIKENSVKIFAISSCIDGIGDREQKPEEILGPVQEDPAQVYPCEYQEEEYSISHENHEDDSFSQIDREEGLDALKEALQVERNALATLEAELEKERNAAAIAASEAMAMISRLQEEKSAMQLEVAQFQRMSEEKAEYDQQAMLLLKEILFKREKEKFALEKEVELYRARLAAQKVDTIKMKRAAKENGDLPIQASKPIKLLKRCEDGASASLSSEQIFVNCGALDGGLGLENMKDLDDVQQKRSKRLRDILLDNCDAKEDRVFAEEAIERAFAFQKPFLESSFSESNQGLFKTQVTQVQKGFEDLTEMGRSVFATDDEETQFILERLWVLEEELQELRGQGSGLEDLHHQACTPVHGNFDCLIDASCASFEDSNKPSYKNFPITAFQSGTEQLDMVPMHVVSSSLPDSVESSRDEGNIADPCHARQVDGSVSRGQEDETRMGGDGLAAAGFLPVHDIYEVQPVSKQHRHHPCNFEGSENDEILRDERQKPDLSPGDMSQGSVSSAVKSKELGLRRVARPRRLFCSNGAMVQSNGWIVKDSIYADNSCEQDCADLHMKTKTMIRDDRQLATEPDIWELTMRLKALEADRAILKQTVESLQQKDTGLDLLQEIVQHLRELRMTDSQRAGAVNLPQETDPHWTASAEGGIPAVKKRKH